MSKADFNRSLYIAKMQHAAVLQILNVHVTMKLLVLLEQCQKAEHPANASSIYDLWHSGAIVFTDVSGKPAARVSPDPIEQNRTWVKITKKGQHLLNQLTQEIRELEDKQSKPEASRTSEVWGTW
jgi:hypothetical protein